MPRYQPADSLASPRFTGVRTFARVPHVQTTEDVDVAVVGLPFDTGATFKVGARFGPESVRSASHMLRPYNVELDVQVFETLSVVDYGDPPVIPAPRRALGWFPLPAASRRKPCTLRSQAEASAA